MNRVVAHAAGSEVPAELGPLVEGRASEDGAARAFVCGASRAARRPRTPRPSPRPWMDEGAKPGGPKKRGPGLAVLLILAYGLAFLAALWLMYRSRFP